MGSEGVTKRNGRSDFRCQGCNALLGYVRRSSLLMRTFTPLSTTRTKYLTGGKLQITCSCGKVTTLGWLGEVVP